MLGDDWGNDCSFCESCQSGLTLGCSLQREVSKRQSNKMAKSYGYLPCFIIQLCVTHCQRSAIGSVKLAISRTCQRTYISVYIHEMYNDYYILFLSLISYGVLCKVWHVLAPKLAPSQSSLSSMMPFPHCEVIGSGSTLGDA